MNIIDTRKNGTGYTISEDVSFIGKSTPIYAYSVFLNSEEVVTGSRINIIEAVNAARVSLENAKRLSC